MGKYLDMLRSRLEEGCRLRWTPMACHAEAAPAAARASSGAGRSFIPSMTPLTGVAAASAIHLARQRQ